MSPTGKEHEFEDDRANRSLVGFTERKESRRGSQFYRSEKKKMLARESLRPRQAKSCGRYLTIGLCSIPKGHSKRCTLRGKEGGTRPSRVLSLEGELGKTTGWSKNYYRSEDCVKESPEGQTSIDPPP